MTKTYFRLGFVLLAAGVAATAGAASSPVPTAAPPPTVQQAEDPNAALSRYLTALAANPQNLAALIGAARAALALGDGHAALSFFGRAEEVAPRDGRIKAGIGSAMVLMQQGASAITFFNYAASLGVPEVEFAGDRGLAFDLLGDPRRAQKDYQLALSRGDDAEIRRCLALSLAISGDRTSALAAIEPQLRGQDRAAWRTRAFVLALTGDTAGATQAVRAVMPAQAEALRPFLAKLPSLSAAERAHAVHFGQFPGEGGSVAGSAFDGAASAALEDPTSAGRPDGRQQPLGIRSTAAAPVAAPAVPAKPAKAGNVASAVTEPQATQIAAATPIPPPGRTQAAGAAVPPAGNRSPPSSTGPPRPDRNEPAQSPPAPLAHPGFSDLTPSSGGLPPNPSREGRGHDIVKVDPSQPAASLPPALAASSTASAKASPAPAMGDGRSVVNATPDSPARSPGPIVPSSGPPVIAVKSFADVAALVASLPEFPPPPVTVPQARPAMPAPAAKPAPVPPRKLAVAGAAAAKDGGAGGQLGKKGGKPVPPKTVAKPAPPMEPSRIWVQVAGGANRSTLPREFRRLKAQAPKLFTGRSAWTTPLRATNRLLVGPFQTEKEAQAFVRQLTRADLAGFSWTSAEGQEIKKLATD